MTDAGRCDRARRGAARRRQARRAPLRGPAGGLPAGRRGRGLRGPGRAASPARAPPAAARSPATRSAAPRRSCSSSSASPIPAPAACSRPTVQHRTARFRHADFLHVGVECEIAVRLATPLPAAGAPYDRDSVAAAVGACMAAIEVVDDRYEDYRSLDTPTLIADDFFNAGCVLGRAGRELARARSGARRRPHDDQRRRGRAAGRGGDILGHPLEALAWLANALAARGRAVSQPASSSCSAAWSRPDGSRRATWSRSRSRGSARASCHFVLAPAAAQLSQT